LRVCDRHPERRARESVSLKNEESHFDLCDECKSDLLRFLTEPPEPPVVRRIRAPKHENSAA